MTSSGRDDREAIWSSHDEELRDPAEIISLQYESGRIDPRLSQHETTGKWWELLRELDVTLIVTREYEHLLLCMRVDDEDGPATSVMPMPHPSGLAVDRNRGIVHVACTRNPNLVYDLMPAQGSLSRLDIPGYPGNTKPLLPVRVRFLPGCLYIHDLAMIDGELHANSVGQNAVVRLFRSGRTEKVWWPKCIERDNSPVFGQNHLQLNSIAAGRTLEDSFFSASTDEITELRPGDPNFPVDRRGVIFSGETREPIVRGLTRPHSARLHDGRIWIDNSGYGEVGFVGAGMKFQSVASLPGWTRGLCFCEKVVFVGTSRVLPRFRNYAPGLEVDTSRCGIHALDVESGRLLGSIHWPFGSQIFSIESVPTGFATGAAFRPDRGQCDDLEKALFYSFQIPESQED
jgi:uncharacterized protein (TIGR03032 family)